MNKKGFDFLTIEDARIHLANSGFLETVNLDKEDEIIEYMYRNNVDVDAAAIAVDGLIL